MSSRWILQNLLLGALVAGAGDNVLHVLAGCDQNVQAAGLELATAAWEQHVPRRAELVIATIDGSRSTR